MYLYGRSRIETTCSETCRNFRIGTLATTLLTQMNETYDDVRTILYIAVIGSGVALIVMLYLVYRRNSATQTQYLYFYLFCLAVLVVVFILLCLLVSDMRSVYNVNRDALNTGAACVTNLDWRKLPQRLYTDTNMDSEHAWAVTWLCFTTVFILVAVVALYLITQRLGQLQKQGWVHTDRELYA